MYDLHLYWVHLFHFNDIVGDHIITGRINMINIIVNAFEKVSQRCFCWWYTIIMTFIYAYN